MSYFGKKEEFFVSREFRICRFLYKGDFVIILWGRGRVLFIWFYFISVKVLL